MHEADGWIQLTVKVKGSQRHSEHRELNQGANLCHTQAEENSCHFCQ